MDNFDITISVQPPTAKQINQQKYLLLHKMITQEAQNFRLALLRILNDKIDFTSLDSKECLLVTFSRTGRHKIDYSSIKDKSIKSKIRQLIESSCPIVC